MDGTYRFSNLWRFSGGATGVQRPSGHYQRHVSVISGDSLVGRPDTVLPDPPSADVSVISGDSLVGRRRRQPVSRLTRTVSVISGDSLVGRPRRLLRRERLTYCFSNLWRFSGGATQAS